MSWWRRLFGLSDPTARTNAATQVEPGLGTVETMDLEVGTIVLDSGRAVRFELDELDEEVARGTRVSVGQLEDKEGTLWAKKVERSATPYEPPALDLPPAPRHEPEPEDPKVVEERRRAYAEHQAQLRKVSMERRARWHDEVASKTWEERLARLATHLEEQSLDAFAESITAKAEPTIRAIATHGESTRPEDSRLGGLPFLPKDTPWPSVDDRPLAFLGQWRLEDIPKDVLDLDLPTEGHLLFFYDAVEQPWGFEPEDVRAWKVLYVPDAATAELREAPEGLDEEIRFSECALHFGPTLTIPSPFSEKLEGMFSEDEDSDRYWEVQSGLDSDELDVPSHQIGGWPEVIQSDMEEQCQLTSSGVRLGNQAEYEASYEPGLEAGAEDWTLLFQIDTDEEGPGWMWGDYGMLYFWIKKTDLAARDFSRVWMILQCS